MSEQDNRRLTLAAAYMKAKDDRKDRIEEQIKSRCPDFSNGRWVQLTNAVLPNFSDKLGVSPSKWITIHSQWIFKDLVYPRFREAFLHALDNIRSYPYQQGWYRRPLRSDCYEDYTSAMGAIIETFQHFAYIDADLQDILTGKLPEEVLAFRQTHQTSPGFAPAVLAYELDRENPAMEAIVKDIICGEGTYATVSRPLIQGIVMSRNPRMHKLLCDLLLAARLQEGLRQTICECADMGTKEAFFSILQTIRDNDLIRFSSVKRAIGTWTALVGENTKDLDRIGEKTLELISGCLADPAYREDCLRSEDSMKIHLALWSIAFHSIGDACIAVRDILQKGTRHQLLTASYFVNALGFGLTSHDVAKSALAEYHTDLELTAAYLPLFLPNHTGLMGGGLFARGIARWTDYFENRKEALHFCDLLTELHRKLPKKGLTYDPCIFPWHKEELKPSVPLEKAMTIALMLNDRERIDAFCPLIPSLHADTRSTYLKAIGNKDKTPAVRAAIITALSDKSDYVRRTAYYLCKEIKLTPAEYRKIEDLLRLKYEDLRRYAADLLLSQSDEALTECLCRLLKDSKTEKRTGALDMLTTLNKQGSRQNVLQGCIPSIQSIATPTTREQMLINNLLPKAPPQKPQLPYTEADRYCPTLSVTGYAAQCLRSFTEYFPHSKLEEQVKAGKEVSASLLGAILPNCRQVKETKELLQDLSDYFRANDTAFFQNPHNDAPIPIGSDVRLFLTYDAQRKEYIAPRMDLWEQWADDRGITNEQLLAMLVLTAAQEPSCDYLQQCGGYIRSIFGAGFEAPVQYPYLIQMHRIARSLLLYRLSEETRTQLSVALHLWLCRCLPDGMFIGDDGAPFRQYQVNGPVYINYGKVAQFTRHPQLNFLLRELCCEQGELLPVAFPLIIELDRRRGAAAKTYLEKGLGRTFHNALASLNSSESLFTEPFLRLYGPGLHAKHFLLAYDRGIITRGNLYSLIMEFNLLQQLLLTVTSVCAAAPDTHTTISAKALAKYSGYQIRRIYEEFVGPEQPLTPTQQQRIALCREVADTLVPVVLESELNRSEEPTEFSYAVKGIQSLSGAETFVRILRSLGKDKPDRGMYYYGAGSSRRSSLSYLLSRCAPAPSDTVSTLSALLAGTDISRQQLIEAALYSPDWIDLIGEHLGIEGFKSACYYFMAHMNERFDDRKASIISRFTPLTEQELNQGAFDLQWFRSAYAQLGEKHFAMIYDAAKYIADGNKHTRARKYADAALGKLNREETEELIRSKRNKELLMAYPLIPLQGEDDLLHRYLFLQQFLKESRSFGAQRAASEKQAVESALQNLSINAGYADTMRLTLQMESRMLDDRKDLFEETPVGEWSFRLHIDEHGSPEILCSKNGKTLKSIPAKAKKEPHVVRLTETKAMLTEQYRRTRIMLEQAMEEETVFTLGELRGLWENPVVRPMLEKLVFRTDGGMGWFDGNALKDLDGSTVTDLLDASLTLAHPLHLYRSGRWSEFQGYIFTHKIVQPFKQVFRELYVKTEDELHSSRSLRYAGNQLQPKKAAACLKGRRWVADYEAGLQKIYYRENIVVTLYALADWFSPSDIEAPTLEWVEFAHRKTGAPIPMEQIPDVLFSEVMRDVDMAVSVAHAGGVDPEASHSTVEMRAALVEYTLSLLGISNAAVEGSHVIIQGTRGKYTVHLGSGVVHQIGGTMLNVLPVHSQHRGKLFLPFLDSDPKTAEIISKVILFSEDKKLKDPTILSQIIQ
ncbi:MAG: DUF4132 domain-containing protein [Oscillospiraceae bacterium]|nr:DUF4132 domain-containing protein [Oscillospiraceae bacterium]